MLFISLALLAVGGVFAFDIGRFATKNSENNTGFTPWARRLAAAGLKFPNSGKLVGWIFLIAGAILLLLTAVLFLASLWR
ncbi:MAG TPA: hypothetical protein VFV41_26670 [Streptosporangiaceae bacterium]|nr:hypothetical protein [Streptosporangiaceae bacterium]